MKLYRDTNNRHFRFWHAKKIIKNDTRRRSTLCTCVEKWRKYTPDVITNIDGHTNDNAVRTVNKVKFKDTDNIFGNDNEEHRNDDDRNESACREGIFMEPTYADIAKRAK